MAPKSSPPPSTSSQKTKQQTISSFFTPKPSQPAKPPPPKPSSPPVQNSAQNASHDFSSDEDEVLPVSQSLTSRRKRVIEDADACDENEAPPAPKRVRSTASNDHTDEDDSVNAHRNSLGHASEAGLNASKPKKLSDRTSKYMFSSSLPAQDENDDENAVTTQQQKQKLHEKFVKKLGRPDSFAELRRKNKIISEEVGEGEDGEEEEEEDETQKPTKSKPAAAKKGGSKLTPMEKQYLDIKRKHLDTIIVMEVGYKFKFLGEDARIASKELGIVCIPGKFRYDERKSF